MAELVNDIEHESWNISCPACRVLPAEACVGVTELPMLDVVHVDRMARYRATLVPANDPVNHPRHYTSHPSGIECIQIVEHMTFCVGNAIKYLWRAGLKLRNDTSDQKAARLEDLKKAKWYLEREISNLESK